MKRIAKLTTARTLVFVFCLCTLPLTSYARGSRKAAAVSSLGDGVADRAYWSELAYQMAAPVLQNMAAGTLQKNFVLETSKIWDGRDPKVAYLECFGRLMAGIAPWLSLPDDDTPEGVRRRQLREWALKAYANAVDPDSPDYLGWESGSQTLVDAAYLCESFLRAYDALWMPLDSLTKARYIKELQGLHRYAPPYSNWLIFVALEEAFLLKVGATYDEYRIHVGLNKMEEWYVGDGWYSDGQAFAFDYYNSFVIQPMYQEVVAVVRETKGDAYRLLHRVGPNDGGERLRCWSGCRSSPSSSNASSRPKARSPSSAVPSPTAWLPCNRWPCWRGRGSCRPSSTRDRCVPPSRRSCTECSTPAATTTKVASSPSAS